MKRSDFSEAEIKTFWSKVDKRNNDECWLWTGMIESSNQKGARYGRVSFKRTKRWKEFRAHRVAYAITYGEVPKGLNCCHKCDNALCVNPDHIFLGTYADNNKDRSKKGRTAGRRLTDEQVVEARELYAKTHITLKELAKRYGIKARTMGGIIRGERYKYTERPNNYTHPDVCPTCGGLGIVERT